MFIWRKSVEWFIMVARAGAFIICMLFILLCTVAAARASIHWLTLIFVIISPYVCRVREERRFIFKPTDSISQSLSVLTHAVALIATVPSSTNRTHPCPGSLSLKRTPLNSPTERTNKHSKPHALKPKTPGPKKKKKRKKERKEIQNPSS
jgi:hypothetical protein